jgi:hypothetical protein
VIQSPQPAVSNFVAAKKFSRPDSDGAAFDFSLSVMWFSAPADQVF